MEFTSGSILESSRGRNRDLNREYWPSKSLGRAVREDRECEPEAPTRSPGEGSRRSPVSPPFGRGVNPHPRVSSRRHPEGTNESTTCAGKRDGMHSKHSELLGGISSRTLRVALTLLSESVLPRSPSRLSLCYSRLLHASRAIACGAEVRVFYPLGPDPR